MLFFDCGDCGDWGGGGELGKSRKEEANVPGFGGTVTPLGGIFIIHGTKGGNLVGKRRGGG